MKYLILIISLFVNSICNAQWINNSFGFVKNFIINNDTLYAGSEKGLIYYNEDSAKWEKTKIIGGINDFCFYNENAYCIIGGDFIVSLNKKLEVDTIQLGFELKEAEKLMHIVVFKNRLFVSTTLKTFCHDLEKNTSVQLSKDFNLPPIRRISELINYHDNLLCLADDGIYIADNNLSYSKLIKNEVFSLKQPFITNIFVINNLLYIIKDSQILYTDNLENWKTYGNFEQKASFHRIYPLCCNGILMGGLGGVYYTFDGINIIPIPWIEKNPKDLPALNDMVIFHGKLFISGNINGKNGIWYIKYNIQLNF